MEKNKSDLIKPETIKIETKSKYDEYNNRFFIVTLTIIDSGITATSNARTGQIEAYNQCLKELEFKYLLDELDTYKLALEFVKSKNEILEKTDHAIICNSCGCDYNNGESGCVVTEIEIRNGHCESFSEKRKWQSNLESS